MSEWVRFANQVYTCTVKYCSDKTFAVCTGLWHVSPPALQHLTRLSDRLHDFNHTPAPRSAELIYSLRLTIIILCFIFFQIMSPVVFNEKNSSNSFWVYLIIGGLSVSLIEEGLWETEVEISQHWGFWGRTQTNYTLQKTSLRLPQGHILCTIM